MLNDGPLQDSESKEDGRTPWTQDLRLPLQVEEVILNGGVCEGGRP